jgi:hypothetical protein
VSREARSTPPHSRTTSPWRSLPSENCEPAFSPQSTSTRAIAGSRPSPPQALDPIPIDEPVADAWALLRILLRDSGQRMPVNDSWIAATAISLGVAIVTQDDDYAEVPGLTVIKVEARSPARQSGVEQAPVRPDETADEVANWAMHGAP